jgi:hypothetical protein
MSRDDWYAALQAATMPEPPMYCTRCGATMVKVERRHGWTAYGVRIIIPAWVCPKGLGWLNRLLMRAMLHDEFEADTFMGRGTWHRVEYR